jgi:hypothetical protein
MPPAAPPAAAETVATAPATAPNAVASQGAAATASGASASAQAPAAAREFAALLGGGSGFQSFTVPTHCRSCGLLLRGYQPECDSERGAIASDATPQGCGALTPLAHAAAEAPAPPPAGHDALAVDWAADGAPPVSIMDVQSVHAPALNAAWGKRGTTDASIGDPPARRSRTPWADSPPTMEEVTRYCSSMSMADLMRADCGRGKGCGGKGGGKGGPGVVRGNYSYGASASGYSAPGRSI